MQGTQPDTEIDPLVSPRPTPSKAPIDPTPPRLGRFTLIERIGQGGMGVVFSAYDPELDRKVAIKVVRLDQWASGDTRGRDTALAEARAMARVSHPNVVAVYEVGATDDGLYVAMEFVRGSTVREWAAYERSWTDVAEVFAQICRGLEAVHATGLIHRDIKPDNLMIRDDGRAQVLDFGIARALGELDPGDTHDRGIIGTPAYLAPELFAGFPADARSDQWALCVAMFEALYGTRPFVGSSVVELATAIAEAKVPTPPKGSEVPRRLYAIIARGLMPLPGQRWPSLAAIATALDDARGVRSRGRLWLVGGAVTVGAVVSVRILAPHPVTCEDTRAPIDAVWQPERSDRLRAAFAAIAPSIGADAWDHTAVLVDDYAQSWIAERLDACEAATVTHLQSSRVMELRMACLERRQHGLAALLDTLEDPLAADVEHALVAVASLDPISECSAEAVALGNTAPPAANDIAEIGDIRLALASVEAQYSLGRIEATTATMVDLQSRADAVGYAPLLIELADLRGEIAADVGDYPASAQAHEDAYFRARAAGDAVAACNSAMHLAAVLGTALGDLDEGSRWLRIAEAERPPIPLPELEVVLHDTRGGLLIAQGRYDDAIASFDLALAVVETHASPSLELERSTIDSNRAIAFTQLGRIDDAITAARRALADDEHSYGPEHPALSIGLGVLARALEASGDYEAAAVVAQRAVTVRERAFGPDSPSLAAPLAQLASVLEASDPGRARDMCRRALVLFGRISDTHQGLLNCQNLIGLTLLAEGRLDEAKVELVRTLVMAEAQLGKHHPSYAALLSNLARVERGLGNLAAAELLLIESVAIHRAVAGGDAAALGPPLLQLGRLQLERGSANDAAVTLEEAMRCVDSEATAPETRGHVGFALASALIASGDDRSRAIALAERARADLSRAQTSEQRAIGRIDAWLAALR